MTKYTKEEKQKAIDLYIRYCKQSTRVIKGLGQSYSHIDLFKELAKKIKRNREFIFNTISYGISNAIIEVTNNKIKLLIRRSTAFGTSIPC